jgi:hypothetical protein
MKKIFITILFMFVFCSSSFGAGNYNNYPPIADKVLQPDGSIVSIISGVVWAPANSERAEEYNKMPILAAKYLMPDGSIINGVPIATTVTGTATEGSCIKVGSLGALVYGSCGDGMVSSNRYLILDY